MRSQFAAPIPIVSRRLHRGVLAAMIMSGVSCTDSTQPAVADDPIKTIEPITRGQIVFFEDHDRGYTIFLADSNGTRLRQLSPENEMDLYPAVSGDGKLIAYTGYTRGGDWDLYVMNADGSHRVRLTNNQGADDRPAWSPDGKRIAFVSSPNYAPNQQIYVINADGTGLVKLTDANGNSGSPEWSSDGSRILFDRDMNGWENKGIFSMSPDGADVRQLTSGHRDKQPTMSPDGTRIAFVRELDYLGSELFVMKADGSDLREVTSGIKTVSDPAWSPDGASIAFGFVSDTRRCVDDGYVDSGYVGETYLCGDDVQRVNLQGVIDPAWRLRSASSVAWQR